MRLYRWVTPSGLSGSTALGIVGEDVAGRAELAAERGRPWFRPCPVLAKHLDRFRIEDDSALLVGLGVLLLQLALVVQVYGLAGW